MADLLLLGRVSAALCFGLATVHADAQTPPSRRAVMEPLAGVQVSYEPLGPEGSEHRPGRFDGTLPMPFGTLRTTVHAVPVSTQSFQRGDISFEWPTRIFGGQLQLQDLQAGGKAAAWRSRPDGGFTAESQCEWTAVRDAQSLRIKQDLQHGQAAQALLSSSRTANSRGSRLEFGFVHESGPSRWDAGIDAAEPGYVTASGGAAPPVGVRLGAQWALFPHARLEARYTRQVHGGAEDAASVMLGTRFVLPGRASLVAGLQTDASDHKATLTLAMPLEIR